MYVYWTKVYWQPISIYESLYLFVGLHEYIECWWFRVEQNRAEQSRDSDRESCKSSHNHKADIVHSLADFPTIHLGHVDFYSADIFVLCRSTNILLYLFFYVQKVTNAVNSLIYFHCTHLFWFVFSFNCHSKFYIDSLLTTKNN